MPTDLLIHEFPPDEEVPGHDGTENCPCGASRYGVRIVHRSLTAPTGQPANGLRYAPDAVARFDPDRHGYVVPGDDGAYSYGELAARGFVMTDQFSFSADMVQADGFMVRCLVQRGDAQRFNRDELTEVVGELLAHYGVTIEPAGTLETVLFRYHQGAVVDAMVKPSLDAENPYRIVATFVSADGQRYSTVWWKVDDPLAADEASYFAERQHPVLLGELGAGYREVSRIILQENEAV